MSGNNDFVPVATAGGAVVLAQAAYLAAAPANGQGLGIVPQPNYNKMMRQGTSMAAAIGAFIAAAGFNANDDGNIAALQAAFAASIASASGITHYSLATQDNSAASRNVQLAAGTWQVMLQSSYSYPPDGNYDFTGTQAGSLGSTTVNTSLRLYRSGGSGFGRIIYGSKMAVGTLTVGTTGLFTMSIGAASYGSLTPNGSLLTVEKIA